MLSWGAKQVFIEHLIEKSIREGAYLYLSLRLKIITAKIKVTKLARSNGKSFVKIPYNSQQKTPTVNIRYITREIDFVSFSLMVFNAWGKKEKVVRKAAMYPKYSPIINILLFFDLNFSNYLDYPKRPRL